MKKLVVCLLIITAIFAAAFPAAAAGATEQAVTTGTAAVTPSSEAVPEATVPSTDVTTPAAQVTVQDTTAATQPETQAKAEDGEKKENNHLGFKILVIVWLVILTAAVGGLGFIVFVNMKNANKPKRPSGNHGAKPNNGSRRKNPAPEISQATSNGNREVTRRVPASDDNFGVQQNRESSLRSFEDEQPASDNFRAPDDYNRFNQNNANSGRLTGSDAPSYQPPQRPAVRKSFMESIDEGIIAAYANGSRFTFAHSYADVDEYETNLNGSTVLKIKPTDKAAYVIFTDSDNGKTYLLPNPVHYNNQVRRFSLSSGSTYGQCVATNGVEGGRIDSYQPSEVQKYGDTYQITKIGKIVWR